MSNLLPVELITDILCRLPVKSLLRFRCVSKSWWHQIDDPYFIKLHLNHSLKTNTNLTLLLKNKNKGVFFSNVEFCSVDLDSLGTAVKLNNHMEVQDGGGVTTRVLGCCNGLVALYKYHHRSHHLVLWNPSTRKYHRVPARSFYKPRDNSCRGLAYGFGYDPVSDDYKLVRIVVCYFGNQHKSQFEIYSFKSNSWRQTRDYPFHLYYNPQANGILANNTLHWRLGTKHDGYRIVAFDLRVEEYFEVPQPDYTGNNCFIRLRSLGDYLCLLCYYQEVRVDVWVMKEYGVKESWIKLAAMDMIRGFEFVNPLAYSKSGDRVLWDQGAVCNKKFVWYDLRRKRIEEVRIQGASELFKVEMCVASLVPLSGGSGTNARKKQAPVKKEQKKKRIKLQD